MYLLSNLGFFGIIKQKIWPNSISLGVTKKILQVLLAIALTHFFGLMHIKEIKWRAKWHQLWYGKNIHNACPILKFDYIIYFWKIESALIPIRLLHIIYWHLRLKYMIACKNKQRVIWFLFWYECWYLNFPCIQTLCVLEFAKQLCIL